MRRGDYIENLQTEDKRGVFHKKLIVICGGKYMKKKVLLFAICISLCFPVQVFAAEPANVLDGDLSLEEGAELHIPTQEEISLERQKLSQANGLSLQRASINKTLNVTTYKQINSYYCGPATVQQTIHFLNGTAQGQAYYANELGTTTAGTDMTKIDDVLNNHTSKRYVYTEFNNYTNWCNMIIQDIVNNNMPPVIDINTENVSEWPYATSGHFLNISGYQNDPTVRVRVTDPYEKGLGNHWYSGPVVYQANSDHWRSAIIW